MRVSNFDTLSPYFPEWLEKFVENKQEIVSLWKENNVDPDFVSKENFSSEIRSTLVDVLCEQYNNINCSELVKNNIQELKNSNAYTVTTGQQIHIYLGPLYVIYKAITCIQLANFWQQKYPHKKIIPVFWMATEDHDIDEINYIQLFGKTFTWHAEETGVSGELHTQKISDLLPQILPLFATNPEATSKLEIFTKAYNQGKNLAQSTRMLLNHFFGDNGLVVIDANEKVLKQFFVPTIKADLLEFAFSEPIKEQTKIIKSNGIPAAMGAKSINHFYVFENKRENIVVENNTYTTSSQSLCANATELEKLIETYPERFSPNVALRPIYQETILPNLAYIGGASEINYWMQLSKVFERIMIVKPILFLRNSYIVISEKEHHFLEKLNLNIQEMNNNKTSFEKILQSKISTSFTLPQKIKSFKTESENILADLYTFKNNQISELKKSMHALIKRLEAESDKIGNDLVNSEETGNQLKKAKNLYEKYFSADSKQERNIYWLEFYLNNKISIEQILQLKWSPTAFLQALTV